MSANRLEFPDDDVTVPLDPAWTDPLDAVSRVLRDGNGVPSDQFFDCCDFMIMARVRRPKLPDLVLYKHIYTRRYINLDAAGHAYRYVPPKSLTSSARGRYVSHRDLRRAVTELGLWELPWMKPSLMSFQRGIGWGDRRLLFDYRTRDLRTDLPDGVLNVRAILDLPFPEDDKDDEEWARR
jgi:hypothetical protein